MSSSNVLATREIMWNIPYSFKVTMYVLLIISFSIMIYGIYQKLQFVLGGKKLKDIIGTSGLIKKLSDLNWKNFFQTIFFTGKVSRDANVGFFHALIYYGFIVLWIATDLVAIHYDTPFKVFQGPVYIIVSFLADFAGLTIITGILLAYKRRYIDRPEKLSATKPNQEKVMYAFLLVT